MPLNRQKIDVDGRETSYWSEGEGSPVVFVHGAGASSGDWQWMRPLLGRSHQLIAPDLPGSGGTPPPDGDFGPGSYARFLRAFVDRLGLGRVSLVANSLGGLYALYLASQAPERIESLVLADSAGLGEEVNPLLPLAVAPGIGDWSALVQMLPPGAAKRAWERATLYFAHPNRAPSEWFIEQYYLAQRPGFLHTWLAALRTVTGPEGQRDVFLDRLPQVRARTLIIWGQYDRLLPTSHASRAAERLPAGRCAILPDCGHLPHVERPDLFARTVNDFLQAASAMSGAA